MKTSTSLEEQLKKDGKIIYKVNGTSMYPMLKQNRDLVAVFSVGDGIDCGDVILYKRKKDGALILHRVISVQNDYYILRGDNCSTSETVLPDQVLGKLQYYVHDGKIIQLTDSSYRFYKRLLPFLYSKAIFRDYYYKLRKLI